MMQRLGWVLAAIVLVLLLARMRALGEPEASNKTELQVWGVWRREGWMRAFAEFERRHPDVKLILSTSGGRMDEQKLMCAIAGGAPPDTLIQDRFSVGGWASRDAFIPLDDWIRRDRERKDPQAIIPEDYYSACWDEAVYRGKVYAIPNSTDDRILVYNEDLLKREGLVDAQGNARPPRTWDELQQYSVKMTKRDPQNRITQVGFIPNYGNSWLYLYGWQNGGEFMSADGRACTLNHPGIEGALKWITGVYDALGGATKVEAFSNTFGRGELDPMLTGKVAMKIDAAPGVLNVIATHKPEMHFGVAPAPVPESRLQQYTEAELAAFPGNWPELSRANPRRPPPYLTWSGGFSWVIPRGARHPQQAWELIKWMSSQEAAVMITDAEYRYNRARGRMFVPDLWPNRRTNEALYDRYAPREERYERAFRFALDMMAVSRFRPVTPVGQILWDEHRRAMDQAIHHLETGMSPKEAVDLGAAKVQSQLDLVLAHKVYPPLDVRVPVALFAVLIAALFAFFAWRLRNYLNQARGPGRTEALLGYVFAGPWLTGFFLLTAGPILASIVLSFCEYDVLHPVRFAGLDNYMRLPRDPLFWTSLGNTVFMVLAVPMGMAVGLGVAMLLNAKVRGLAFYRTVYYLPSIVPIVASSILWIWVLNPQFGLVNSLLKMVYEIGILKAVFQAVGFTPPTPEWLQNPAWSKPALILMGLWGAGAGMIIWLAGLQGIPQALYEAASIDGAPSWSQFRNVTLPMLSPYIFFNLLMGMIGTFQVFTNAFIMTDGQGGPVDSTLFYIFYLFNNAFRYFKLGYASSLAWILFVIILGLTLIQMKLAPRWVYYEGGEAS